MVVKLPKSRLHGNRYASPAECMPGIRSRSAVSLKRGTSLRTLTICFLILYAAIPARLLAQATDCNDPSVSPEANAVAQQQWENQSSPVYSDATELARTLNERGFLVQCIRRSTEERLFQDQKGAAWFKTDQGIFEAWFLPKPETFAGLEINDESRNDEYVYSFRGKPQILITMGGTKQSYFIKYQNVLFHVIGDERLAASIRKAFQEP
jgi:hypothetical protein